MPTISREREGCKALERKRGGKRGERERERERERGRDVSDNMLQMLSNVAIIIKCPKNPIKSDNTHTQIHMDPIWMIKGVRKRCKVMNACVMACAY